jgi:ATP-dependent Clp protease ATP-binding subunit ClpC
VLTLRYLQGYSAAEVGELLGMSANYVRVLQFRALRRAALLDTQERSRSVAEPGLPYDEKAERVLTLAQEEAFALHHNYVGTEHLLLGILREGSAPGAVELANHGITLENMRSGISFILGRFAARPGSTQDVTTPTTPEQIGFTGRTAEVLALAGADAESLLEAAISPQHMLVAILREGQGVAAMLLQVSGVRWRQVGKTVEISVLEQSGGKPPEVPADFQAELQKHPEEQSIFTQLASFKQKQLIDQIEHADGETARRQAMERVLEILHHAYLNRQQVKGGDAS